MNHQRQAEGARDLLRASQHFPIVRTSDVPRQPGLHADNEVAVLGDRVARGGDVGPGEIHRVAVRQNPRPPDVDQHAPRLQRGPRDGDDVADAVGPLGSGVDPAGHPVLQHQLRPIRGPARMGVDVEKSRDDELAARVYRLGRIPRDGGLDSADAPARDRHVAGRVESNGGVDNAPTSDDEVVLRLLRPKSFRDTRKRHGTGGCRR